MYKSITSKFQLLIIILLIASAFSELQVYCQIKDSITTANRNELRRNPEGREFWVCFETNYRDDEMGGRANRLFLELFITGEKDANVAIDVAGINYKTTLLVKGKTVANVQLPVEAQMRSYEIKEKLAVHITSNEPVSVYGLNRRFQTTDTYLALPTEFLGTEYRVMCYKAQDDLLPQFALIGTEDNTEVVVTTPVNTMSHPAKTPFKVYLNKGDVYQIAGKKVQMSKEDLTGSTISSTKKIAVFSGHQCAYVPQNITACNHLVEQMPPIQAWGKHFYIGRLKSRSYYSYRILANEPNTRVFEDSKLVKILQGGEFYENISKKNLQITADKPILVAQFSQGMKNGDNIGDPMMLLVSPTQQFLQRYRFATPINGSWRHFVNLVAPMKGIKALRLDGKALDPSQFEPLGLSRYGIAYIQVPFGTHTLEGDMPFGMYSYGFGEGEDAYDAYGTMGGQSFTDYEPVKDTLPPTVDLQGVSHESQVLVRDDRIDDSGIREVKVLEAENFTYQLPAVELGMPQFIFSVKVPSDAADGRLVFEATDVAMNKTTYTLCYSINPKTDQLELNLNEGSRAQCMGDPGIIVGVFGRVSPTFHTADFRSDGQWTAPGSFSNSFAISGFGGLYLGRRITSSLQASVRLSIVNYGGTLEAQDDSIRQVRTEGGQLKPFQESRLLKLKGLFLNPAIAMEYHFHRNFYAVGGFEFSIPLSSSVEIRKKILMPDDYSYLDLSREMLDPKAPTELASLSKFSANLLLGVGFNYSFNYRVSVFSELNYNYALTNLTSEGTWKPNKFNLLFGVRYRFNWFWNK